MNETRSPQSTHIRRALDEIGPASWSELVSHLGVGRGKGGNRLRRVIHRMLDGGEIVREGRNRYRLNNAKDESGVVERSGSQLFVSMQSGGSTALESVNGIRDGDNIRVRVSDGVARFVELIKPSAIPVVGIYRRDQTHAYVESLEPGYNERVELVAPYPGCREGDVVEVQILDVERGRIEGRAKAVIKHRNEVERACTAIVRAHRIPNEWPSAVTHQRV